MPTVQKMPIAALLAIAIFTTQISACSESVSSNRGENGRQSDSSKQSGSPSGSEREDGRRPEVLHLAEHFANVNWLNQKAVVLQMEREMLNVETPHLVIFWGFNSKTSWNLANSKDARIPIIGVIDLDTSPLQVGGQVEVSESGQMVLVEPPTIFLKYRAQSGQQRFGLVEISPHEVPIDQGEFVYETEIERVLELLGAAITRDQVEPLAVYFLDYSGDDAASVFSQRENGGRQGVGHERHPQSP